MDSFPAKMGATLRKLERVEIFVGWIDGNGSASVALGNLLFRRATGKTTQASRLPATQALIARTLNYGRESGITAEGRKYPAIPPRPFMRFAREIFERKAPRIWAKLIPQVLSGRMTVEAFAEQVAIRMKDAIVEAIRTGNYAPLSPVTIEKKGSAQPLIDTGTMVNSVTFEVRTG